MDEFARCCVASETSGVRDRVTFDLPMVPELPVSTLACARWGIHSEVFGGFSGHGVRNRIAIAESILVTMDGYYRNGELIDYKLKADEAIAAAREEGHEVDKVLVWRRREANRIRRARWSRAATSSSTS